MSIIEFPLNWSTLALPGQEQREWCHQVGISGSWGECGRAESSGAGERQEPDGEDAIPNLMDLNFGKLLKAC